MLRNVTFLVVPSEQAPFSDLPAGKQGILGFPVLLSFEKIRWGVDRAFEMGSRSRRDRRRSANLTCTGIGIVSGRMKINRAPDILCMKMTGEKKSPACREALLEDFATTHFHAATAV